MSKEAKESVKELIGELFRNNPLGQIGQDLSKHSAKLFVKWHLQKQIELLDKLIKELEERKIRFMGRYPLYVERQELKKQLKAIKE